MARTTFVRDPAEVKKTNNLGSLQLRHIDSNQIILIPTPTNDPNGASDVPSRWIESPLTSSRSSKLVFQISLVHRYSGVCSHLLLQLPRRRPNRGHNGSNGRLLWRSTGKCQFCRGHLEDGLLLHHNRFDAGHWCFPMDATDRQVRSPSGVRFFLCPVHDLRCMGWCVEELWQRVSLAYCYGCCCRCS